MDDVPARVFQPSDGEDEWAIVIDSPFEALFLRDLLRREAKDRETRAANSVQGRARTRNAWQQRVLEKYAERCEYIRLKDIEQSRASAFLIWGME